MIRNIPLQFVPLAIRAAVLVIVVAFSILGCRSTAEHSTDTKRPEPAPREARPNRAPSVRDESPTMVARPAPRESSERSATPAARSTEGVSEPESVQPSDASTVTPGESRQPPPKVAEKPPAPAEPAEPPEDPPLPDYLRVVTKIDRMKPFKVAVEKGPPNRLMLDTENVSRIRIDRARFGLAGRKSIVLRLDGQVIEWTARSKVTEFTRTRNGVWRPVRP